MKVEEQLRGSTEGSNKTAADNKHKRVMEAVEEGLLQVHGFAPNTKQPGIFQLMGKNVVSRLVMYRTKVPMYRMMVLLACLTKVRR
jgi:hypothetical protein